MTVMKTVEIRKRGRVIGFSYISELKSINPLMRFDNVEFYLAAYRGGERLFNCECIDKKDDRMCIYGYIHGKNAGI